MFKCASAYPRRLGLAGRRRRRGKGSLITRLVTPWLEYSSDGQLETSQSYPSINYSVTFAIREALWTTGSAEEFARLGLPLSKTGLGSWDHCGSETSCAARSRVWHTRARVDLAVRLAGTKAEKRFTGRWEHRNADSDRFQSRDLALQLAAELSVPSDSIIQRHRNTCACLLLTRYHQWVESPHFHADLNRLIAATGAVVSTADLWMPVGLR